MLNAGNLVTRRAIVLRKLGFYDDLWIEFIGNDEIRRLVEIRKAFRPLCPAVTDAGPGQHVFNSIFDDVSDQLADRIPMTGERTTEKTFVEQNGVGNAQISQ